MNEGKTQNYGKLLKFDRNNGQIRSGTMYWGVSDGKGISSKTESKRGGTFYYEPLESKTLRNGEIHAAIHD